MIREKLDFKDKTLTCLECGQDFVFSSGEQFFYWGKGLAEPKRCKSCRQFRRKTINRQMEGYDGNNSTN